VFRIQVISNPDVRSPIITLGSTSFFHVRLNNVYIVGVTKWANRVPVESLSWPYRCNASAALVFEFLYRFVNISKSYFGKLDEESVKNNFVLIYELLDGELWAAPFEYSWRSRNSGLWLSPKFRDWHAQDVHHDRKHKVGIGSGEPWEHLSSGASWFRQREDSSKITIQATGATSWRRSDVKYRKNEAFVDVIETVNLMMSKDGKLFDPVSWYPSWSIGAVLRADVDGQVMMRAYLSGTPECKFGLNDKLILQKRSVWPAAQRMLLTSRGTDSTPKSESAVELDDCQFHQCVRLGKFDSDRSISFIPPDGEFELMRWGWNK
jgi:AP-2 complex subunit mu-1